MEGCLFWTSSLDLFLPSSGFSSTLRTIYYSHLGHLNNDKLVSLFKLGSLEPSLNKYKLSSFVKSKDNLRRS